MKSNKSLLTIFLIVFIDLLGFGIILPLLPYIAEKYQATPLQIGIISAAYSFFQLIASPILGRLSDRYGRKKILIISQLGSTIGYLILGLAGNLPLLFLSRIIDGITGGNISIAQAYIADVTTKENRAKGMGLIGAAFGLGFIFGPAIGGALSKISYSAQAYFATAVSLITVFATMFFLKETVNEKKDSLVQEIDKNLTLCYKEKIELLEEESKFEMMNPASSEDFIIPRIVCNNVKQFMGFAKKAVSLTFELLFKNPEAFLKFTKLFGKKVEENPHKFGYMIDDIVNLSFCDFIHNNKGTLRFLNAINLLIRNDIDEYLVGNYNKELKFMSSSTIF